MRRASGIKGLLASLPRILAGDTLRAVVESIAAARAKQKPVVWAMGGHVIKCGLAPVLIDLMHTRFRHSLRDEWLGVDSRLRDRARRPDE